MPQRERYVSQYSDRDEREIRVNVKESSKKNKPKVDEIWYVRIGNAVGICTMKVKDLTEHTVVLINFNTTWSDGTRYALNDIEFIEKVK